MPPKKEQPKTANKVEQTTKLDEKKAEVEPSVHAKAGSVKLPLWQRVAMRLVHWIRSTRDALHSRHTVILLANAIMLLMVVPWFQFGFQWEPYANYVNAYHFVPFLIAMNLERQISAMLAGEEIAHKKQLLSPVSRRTFLVYTACFVFALVLSLVVSVKGLLSLPFHSIWCYDHPGLNGVPSKCHEHMLRFVCYDVFWLVLHGATTAATLMLMEQLRHPKPKPVDMGPF